MHKSSFIEVTRTEVEAEAERRISNKGLEIAAVRILDNDTGKWSTFFVSAEIKNGRPVISVHNNDSRTTKTCTGTWAGDRS